MKICTNLPHEIHSLTYVKNHHWIELEDTKGRKTKLHDNGLLRYECPGCKFFCFTPHNNGTLLCPVCKGTDMVQQWQRIQVCFVPENESDFKMPKKGEE